ncbi:MAG: hypothetical protein JNK09_19155 [Prolixibacteraceae bacterium]|nr:hypothetical protein [Prolixibacteraceae bacterium]
MEKHNRNSIGFGQYRRFFGQLLMGILAFIYLFPQSSVAQTGKDSAVVVNYGIYLKKLVPNFKDGRFYAEFYWWAIFENDSSVTGFNNDQVMNFEYINGYKNEVGIIRKEIEEVKKLGDNRFYYTGLHQGEFYFNPEFRMYPFDHQSLTIGIENSLIPATQLRFAPDSVSYLKTSKNRNYWGLSDELIHTKNSSYNILKTEIFTSSNLYNTNFGDETLPAETYFGRISTSVVLSRSIAPYISKILIPLVIILLLVYMVFFMPAKKIDIAAGLTVTSLLSAIAFQLSISGELPEIGYIIYVDKIFYTCYFLIAASMALSLYTYYLDASGVKEKRKLADRIDIISRIVFPLIFFFSLIWFAV